MNTKHYVLKHSVTLNDNKELYASEKLDKMTHKKLYHQLFPNSRL